VNARILYWGIEGAGKRTNLQCVYAKLRPDHRGEMREVPTRLDPSVSYAVLPIELGEVASVQCICWCGAWRPGTGADHSRSTRWMASCQDDPRRTAGTPLLEERAGSPTTRRLEDPLVVQQQGTSPTTTASTSCTRLVSAAPPCSSC
jgi:hypothetical protein